MKKSQPLTFQWEARDIPADMADGIRAGPAEATDEAGIKAAFEVTTQEPEVVVSSGKFQEVLVSSDPEIKTLADALNNMAAAMMVQPAEVKADMTPVPQPITINLTAQMPAPGAPTVTVNVPDQPAPVVTVTNEVQPAAVTVTNEVQPAPVKVEKPKMAKVTRDIDGRITGIEA